MISREHHRVCRRAFMMTELVVAATLLVTAMTVVMPLIVNVGRMWQDTRHHRLAIEELTNHLEYLSALGPAERSAAIDMLQPSPHIRATLSQPNLSAETVADDNGTRLVLSLNWEQPGHNSPVTLVGWIEPPTTEPRESGEPR